MREQGGGTLFSPAIERTKLSVKVTESNESRRRLSSSGGYASYVGAKSIAGSMPPVTAGGGRLKGGSSIHGSGVRHHPNHNNELSDHSVQERVKEFLAESEPVVKRKAAPPPLQEEGGVLPQWGHGKRSRCSRLELSKHATAAGADESVSKAVVRVEKQSKAAGVAAKLRGQGGPSRPASMAANGHGSKGAAARNGISIRGAANGNSRACSPARYAITASERERPSPHKGDQGGPVRQGGTEPTTTSDSHHQCNGHNLNAAAHNNGGAAAASSSEAQQQQSALARPRVDLETLEWPRIFIGLSRKEKEDDFLIFKGTKLPQRPKKRPKAVEKAIQYCTPGNWLCDLARGRYDVREKKCVKKKPRGLKAMESMESQSE